MKMLILLCLLGVAVADSDLRQVVGYQGPSSSVSILRGADLVRGGNSGEVRVVATRQPRVQLIQQQLAGPSSAEQQYQQQRIVYQAPQPRYRPTLVYRRPEPRPALVYRRPEPRPTLVYRAPEPQVQQRVVVQQQRVRDDSREYGDVDAQYQFAYEVNDDYTRNYQSRQESRDGHRVQGVYNVLEPDGQLRTVTYGDDGNGFYATVTRQPSNLYGGAVDSGYGAPAATVALVGGGVRDDSSEGK